MFSLNILEVVGGCTPLLHPHDEYSRDLQTLESRIQEDYFPHRCSEHCQVISDLTIGDYKLTNSVILKQCEL